MTMIVNENRLHDWVCSNSRDAQGMIVDLIYRLVAASSPNPNERRFPLGDSIGQPGPDGVLDTDFDFKPFVPEGKSYWEIGASKDAQQKANDDYADRTRLTPEKERQNISFIFVTPLSGRISWQYTWKEDAQAAWIDKKKRLKEWKNIDVIDGTRLIDWLSCFPAVEQWLAIKMDIPMDQMETVEQRWDILKEIGSPPPLIPEVFLANRRDACDKLKNVFEGERTTVQLKLETHFPDQVANFIAAYVESMDTKDAKLEVIGRCLIIESSEAWKKIISMHEQHFLIADFNLDNDNGTRLLAKARREGHIVVYRGLPGGIPLPPSNQALLPNPRINQIQVELEKSGYGIMRARTLSQKSGGNLSYLLRLLQNFSCMPEWAQRTDAADLAIAELLGGWNDLSDADKSITEKLSGKAYGEWIRIMHEILLRQDTPLNHLNDIWKFNARYEGWYALGSKLFDADLDRLKAITVAVLRERDPKFELPPDKRFAANVYGKVLCHSYPLRRGLAESLALIGSHPRALRSCSRGKAETTATLAVREILSNSDWVLWGSLNDLLPLLAEAAPEEFLNAVEKALKCDTCPFNALLEQRGSGITSFNYMAGLLWALEDLAWDTDYLIRVVVLLGELATKVIDGNQGNTPMNSLSTILLPWFPQTCATVLKRKAAVNMLINMFPEVAWNLLLSLLPQSHQISSGSYKPTWRETIPDDWSEGAKPEEYREQVIAYTDLAIGMARGNYKRLIELVDRLNDLWPQARAQVLDYLGSEAIVSMPEAERVRLWTELVNLVSKHRKFADTMWAMKPEYVDEIATVAGRLAPNSPIYLHQRLFGVRVFDLYEERGDYKKQQDALEDRRQKAVEEVFAEGGVAAVLEFAKAVESPWHVGFSFAFIMPSEDESIVLPALLESKDKSILQLAGGFVWGKFWTRKWQWVDQIDIRDWTPAQKGQFLAFLPFSSDTWERVARYLGEVESPYWSKASVNPSGDDQNLETAIDRLVDNGRAPEAMICFEQMLYKKRALDSRQAFRVLRAVLQSPEGLQKVDINNTIGVIKSLQDDPSTNPYDMFEIEWAFLPLLDGFHGASPKLLEHRLADDPVFFSDVIRHAFRSKKEGRPIKEPNEEQKNIAARAYRLLHNWRIPPGSQKYGTYDGDVLTAWLENVKEICRESGHLDVALTMIGQVIFNVPSDPDGFWINHSAARALNDDEAEHMRTGFQTAVIASRGVYFSSGGEEERRLASKYLSRADKSEDSGYHRLATTFREVAAFYEGEAEQEASRALFGE